MKRKTRTLEVFNILKEKMKPGMCYRIEPLCQAVKLKKPALRRYLRRLVNAGLIVEMKHPEYPKRKWFHIPETRYGLPGYGKIRSPSVNEGKEVNT